MYSVLLPGPTINGLEIPSSKPGSLADLVIDRRVYEGLGTSHPKIIRYLGFEGEGICLERAKYGSICEHFMKDSVATLYPVVRGITDALQHVHDTNVRHVLDKALYTA